VIDHLVYATPDIDASVAFLAAEWGITATPGGSHPGGGTRNALIALGPSSYLEIIGPDSEQPAPPGARPFGIDELTEPRLVTWAARVDGIEETVERARGRGFDPGPVIPLSRCWPDDVVLRCRLTFRSGLGDGIVPFLVEWDTREHPAQSSAGGARLLRFRGEHPRPDELRAMLKALDLDLEVAGAAEPALIAVIETPRRRGELR